MRIGVYPGTFDPITYGHLDIIKRAASIVDQLIIGVAKHSTKSPLFSLEDRLEMVKHDTKHLNQSNNIIVKDFEGLLVDFATQHNAQLLVRGLRAVSDFEYEFQMAGMNAKLDNSIQTVFLPASESTHFIASSFVREIAKLKGNVSDIVSEHVQQKLNQHFHL